jgi:hypothetical protein
VKFTESDVARALDKGILTEYEASLIRRIDLAGKGVTQTADEDGKSKGTVSLQHSTAARKLSAYFEEERKAQAGGDLAADVFKMLDDGKPLTSVVTKLRADPEEVQRLAKMWAKMKSEDLNDPGMPGLLAKQSSRISKLEAMLEAGEDAEDDGLVTYSGLGEYLDAYFGAGLGDLSERVAKLEKIPITNLYDDFKCSNCGSTHLVSVKVKCTKCETETSWGYQPK